MPAPFVSVRPARTSDVDDIGVIQVASWRQRFAGILPAPVLDALSPRDIADQWATSLLLPPTRDHHVLVAVADECVVGFAAIGPAGDPDADPSEGELIALEVDPAAQRGGHGSRLISAAVDHARDVPWRSVTSWYPLADEARRAFLASAGWGPDGAYRDLQIDIDSTLAAAVVREVRLVTVVDADA